MDAQHSYEVTIDGQTYAVDSPQPLSDGQAYRAALSQHTSSPEAQAKKNAALAEANKRPLPSTPTLGDEFTPAKMLERGLAGAKGEVEGAVGGLAAPLAAMYQFARHPVDTVVGAGKVALGAAALARQAVEHPSDAYEGVKDAAVRFGLNPEAIGAAAGATGAAIATPALVSAARGTRLGNAVVTGVSDAANRIPGVKAARAAYAGPKPSKLPTPPPSLDEQLGVSPASTGATINDLPPTAPPVAARVAMPLAHDSARTAAAADATRGAAADLGVAADPPLAPSAVLAHPESMPPTAEAGVRERIPVPVRLRDVTKPQKVRSFADIAKELGLNPDAMSRDFVESGDPHMPAVLPAERPVSGPQGVPAEAQVASPLRATLDAAPEDLASTLTPPAGLSPEEKLVWMREELSKELMSRESFRNGGQGTRKRGSTFQRKQE